MYGERVSENKAKVMVAQTDKKEEKRTKKG
jgi:hypothetical protein